jgi:DNA-binding CsgD family transcriptional regulator
VADPQAGAIVECETVNIDPNFESKYREYYLSKEVRLAPALSYPVGMPLTEQMLLDRRALETSEVYADLLLPSDLPHFMITWLQKRQGFMQCVAIEGTKKRGPFGPTEMERFALLIPHLIRAVRLRETLVVARESRLICFESLNALPFGVIFLDHTGKITEVTVAAERLLARADGITQIHNRVHATEAHSNRQLQHAIKRVIKTNREEPNSADTLLLRRLFKASLSVSIVPIRSGERVLISPLPRAMVLLVDPTESPRPKLRTLQDTLGLTEAEAALAHTLYAGISLREAADTLGVSVNTCKTQLKSVYAKTACKSHVQLVKKMMTAMMMEVIRAGSSHHSDD